MMSYLNILLPVYNEEFRLEKGVRKLIAFFNSITEDEYELTILDNASSDRTSRIAQILCNEYRQVNYIRLETKGVGVAFRAGIRNNNAPIVGYMDIDLSTDVSHITEVLKLFRTQSELEIINASRYNKKSQTIGRKWYRNLTSQCLTLLLKITLGMKATDSICGFKFFRKQTAEWLVSQAKDGENGWFYIIELLLRAERAGLNIYELPVRWQDDVEHSTVKVWNLILNYCRQILRLRKTFRTENIL